MISAKPYASLKYREILGKRLAYIDEGEGDAIVFQHGQPTSSYAWRNVMPHLNGLGRLIACDLIGMGGSEKLSPPGPDRYRYAEHRDFLFSLWDALTLGDRVVLVLDDWGAALGFHWARTHPERVRGIVHMEAIAMPMHWSDLPEQGRPFFRALRSPQGESMVLQDNIFIEKILPAAVLRQFSDEEMDHYRRSFKSSGEDRRPMLSWPRSLPLDGEPAEIVDVVTKNAAWLAQSDVPKLFINGDPGQVVQGRVREAIRTWKNQTEVTVKGRKLLQEDSPHEIGAAIVDFIKWLNQREQRNVP
jgi:haloalkane dehalogenase